MPVGTVVRDIIQDNLKNPCVGRSDQRVEVSQRAEKRVDIGEIGHIITEVGHGRGVNGRQPKRIDAQPLQVVEPLNNVR
jgi:hypothetical protein